MFHMESRSRNTVIIVVIRLFGFWFEHFDVKDYQAALLRVQLIFIPVSTKRG